MNKRNYLLSFMLILSCFSSLSSQATYCASKGNTPWQEWIASVQFGTINNASQKEGYGNFTSQSTSVNTGTSYPLSISQGFSWAADPTNQTQQGRAWIDYNQNGTFEATELVASFTRTTVTANVTIPTTALTGVTRMRVSLKTTGAPTACEVFDKGEVEDYTINIGGGTTGGNLPDLVISNLVVEGPIIRSRVLSLSYTLKNNSTVNIPGNFVIRTYYSTDQILSSDDLPRGSLGTGNFEGGYTVNVPNQIDATVRPGDYYLIAKVDGNDQITESNENNNIVVSDLLTVVDANSVCLNKFTLDFIFPNAGECVSNSPNPNVNPATFQMLGSRIADGFALYIRQSNLSDLQTRLFAKTAPTTTPPAGVTFRACTGVNWLYFKTDGFSQDERFTNVIPSRYVRVAYVGAETNPDSIIVETEQLFSSSIILKSNAKTVNCSPCVVSDRTAPVFNCPTTTITYSQPFSPNTLRIENITDVGFGTPGTNVKATDNCNAPLVGFQFLNNVFFGGVYPISLVAYDSAGNKAACNFNIRMPCSSFFTAPTISNCPTNISVQAAAGQTCAVATWTAPTFNGNGSPAALSSNFASGTCFPIGTTPVVLTVKDSCDNTERCNFNVTVTGGNVSNCRNNYGLVNFDPVSCQSSGGPPPTPAIGMFVDFLGATLADGFYLSTNNSSQPTNKSNLWSKTVVAPQPALFNNCPGNWTYFKAYGFSTIGEQVFENLDKVHENVIVRIKGIGTINPLDQIIVEVSNSEGVFNFGSFQSSARRIKCSACSFTDNTPPVISNCPTTPVIFPLRDIKSYGAKEVSLGANIAIADNCSDNFSNFRTGNSFRNSNDGASFPLTLVAFDSAGNRATCNFTVKTSNANPTTYCAAKGTAPWEYWVGNVSLGTINNTSDKFKDFATLGYSDYTSISTTLNKGQSYPLSISPGLSWIGNVPNAYCRVWIDFNQNNAFEANELVLEKTNQNPLTQNVLIPTTALTGNTRMRVALKFGAYPTSCETFDKGEVEDYTVNITGGTVGGTSPDLTISGGLNVNIVAGQTLKDGQLYVANRGNRTAVAPFTVNLYLSTDALLSTNDRLLSKTTLTTNLIAGDSVLVPADAFSIPADVLGGTYQFIFKADGDNNLSESSESNNLLIQSGTVRNPNLTASLAAFPNIALDQTVTRGDSFTLIHRLFSFGSGTPRTDSFTVRAYFSRDTFFSADDYVIRDFKEYFRFDATSTGFAFFQTALVPANFANGTYYIVYELDYANTVLETIETDNKSYIRINWVGGTVSGQPDLTLANLTVPTPSVLQGQILNFKADLKNIGNAAASGNFTVKSYLSTDPILSANDYQDGIIPTANFAAGLTSPQVVGAMAVNATVAAGQYYLILKIDADNQITESDENNNVIVGTGLITVTGGTTGGGGDLALSIISTPSVYRKYSVNTIRVTTQNVGNQTLTNVKVELKRPALTSNGGSKVPSVGTFKDFCPGGIECSEWTIPTLAAGATATLDAPFFVLDATGGIVVTTKLLGSTPTDANTVNNTATVSISPAAAGAAASILALSRPKPTQFMPIVVQSIEPTLTDGNVTVRLESIVEKEVSFNIYNSMGKQIFSEKRKIEKGENLLNFDVSDFPQGMYLIAPESSFARNAPSKFVKF
jgi:GEVED domain/CARDB/HYR domain/Domain of unknown function DUF11/Secretion system C-terminal sorting domain